MVVAIKRPIVEWVREEWSVDPDISARETARRFVRKYGPDLVKERTIIGIVGAAKREAPQEPFPLTPWEPWGNPEESPEESLFILKLHHLKRREGSAGLFNHEAVWARRLWKGLEGLQPHQQLELIQSYGEREKSAHYLNTTLRTSDLDSFVVYQPWRSPECQKRYEKAIADDVVPVPFLGSTASFLKELRTQGRGKVRAAIQDRLSWHPIYQEFLKEDGMQPGWSEVFLQWLDDPQDYQPVIPAPVKGSVL